MTRTTKATAPANTMVAYLRVSTTEQADSGAGLAAQRTAIEAAAVHRGWTIVAWHVDAGASGKSMTKRPELAAALSAVREKRAAGLLVAKLDRLSRSVIDCAKLMDDAGKQGWNLVVLDLGLDLSTPAGEFAANVMASAAQWERRIISQRTKDGLAAKKAEGVVLGRRSTLPAEVVERIVQARRDGQSLGAIADALNADAVATGQREGARWHRSTVSAVLASRQAAEVAS